ncbi:hypothetical protein A4X06_0g184 [Tilletia controversa]|uniref:Uncharacterized protein n=1 Tax=Tilletia controversa TaxID=13291 RepID=A0A8X7MZM2_9BASI|nr:hypothetical protein CF328_g552 [Tilletia controversa]KAE8255893.1 hypothetical protein A4X06_0g184 [Tilletia controversa]
MKRSYPFNNTQAGSPNLPKKAGPSNGVTAGPAPNAYANYGYGGNAAAAAQAASAAAHSQPAQPPPPPPPSVSHDQQQAQWHQQWQQYYAQQAATSAGASQMQGGHYNQPHAYQQQVQPPAQSYAQPAPPAQQYQQHQQQSYYAQAGPQYNAPPQHMSVPYPQHAYAGGPPAPMGPAHSGPMAPMGMNPTGMRLGHTTSHGPAPSLGPQQSSPMPTGPQGGNSGPNFHSRTQLPAAPGTYTPMGSGSGFAAPMAGPHPSIGGGRVDHQNQHNAGQRNAKRPRFDGPNSGAGGGPPGSFAAGHSSLPAPPTGPSGVVRPQTGHMGPGVRKPGGPSQFSSPVSNRGGPGPGPIGAGTPSGPRMGGFTTPSQRGPGAPGGRDFGGGGGQGMGRTPSGPRGAGPAAGPSHFRSASIAGSEDSRYSRDGRDRDRERDRDRYGPGGRSDRDRDAGGRERGPRQGPGFLPRTGGPGSGASVPGGRGPSAPGSSYSSSLTPQGRGARQRSPAQHRHLTRDFRGQPKGGSAAGASGRDSFGGPGRNSQNSQSAAFAGRSGGGPAGSGVGSASASGGMATLPAKVVAGSGLGAAVPTGPKSKADINRRGTTDLRVVGMTFGGAVAWEWTLDDGAALLSAAATKGGSQGDRGKVRGSDEDHGDSDGSEDDDERDGERDRDDLEADSDSDVESDEDRSEQKAGVKEADHSTSTAGDHPSAVPADSQSQSNGAAAEVVTLPDVPPAQAVTAESETMETDQAKASEVIDSAQPADGSQTDAEKVEEALPSETTTRVARDGKKASETASTSKTNGDAKGKGKGKAKGKDKQEGKQSTAWNHPETCRLRICFGIVTTSSAVEATSEVVTTSKREATEEVKTGGVQADGTGTEPASSSIRLEEEAAETEKESVLGEASSIKAEAADQTTEEAGKSAVDDTAANGTTGEDVSKPEAEENGTVASEQVVPSAEAVEQTDPTPANSWTPFSKAPPQPANNRITLIYAQAQKRIHIDADVIHALRIFRDERRVEIDIDTRSAALARQAEAKRSKDGKGAAKVQDWMVCKGILLEARDDEQRNYVPISLSRLRSAHGAALVDVKMAETNAETKAEDADPHDTEAADSTKAAAEPDSQKLALNALPPLFRLRDAEDPLAAMTTIVVHLDRAFPVRQTEWLRTGDIEDFLSSFEAPPSSTGGELIPNPWRSKIYVEDPDQEPTIDDILQIWLTKSFVGSGRERRRFLREYFESSSTDAAAKNEDEPESHAAEGTDANSVWAMGQIFGRLGQGKPERYILPTTTAAKIRSASTMGPNPLTVAATADLFGPGHAQSVAGLCSVALFDLVQEMAPAAGWSDADVRARLGQMLMGLPQHTLFRALDSLFKDYRDMTREREREAAREAGRNKAREERERACEKKSKADTKPETEDVQSEPAAVTNGDEAKPEIHEEQSGGAGADQEQVDVVIAEEEQHEEDLSEFHDLVPQLTEAEDAVVAQMIDDVAMQIAAEAAL